MINLNELTNNDIGRWVTYNDGHGKIVNGRIKSWNHTYIFVAYNCADDWDHYYNYTGAATRPEDVTFK